MHKYKALPLAQSGPPKGHTVDKCYVAGRGQGDCETVGKVDPVEFSRNDMKEECRVQGSVLLQGSGKDNFPPPGAGER